MTSMTKLNRAWRRSARLTLAIGAGTIVATGAVVAQNFRAFETPVSASVGSHPDLNTPYNDGCPILSPDGLSLYMASNRPGGEGGQDIWVARREGTHGGWQAPRPLAEVNGPFDDFCPTPVRGRGLFFVSRRDEPNGDIYFVRQRADGRWHEPTRLGPNINSALEEWSPSLFHDKQNRPVLYFSRNTPGTNSHDIYASVDYGPAAPALGGINGSFSDARPNVRKDGLEIVWDSNRPGAGGQDIWTARRDSTDHAWGEATRLGNDINSVSNETRASLSWDGSFLLFGSNRVGVETIPGVTDVPARQGDIFVAYRARGRGNAQ